MTSYIPQVRGVGEREFVGNGLRFAAAEEALAYAADLQGRWMGCQSGADNRRAHPSDDPVSHRWLDGRAVSVAPPAAPPDAPYSFCRNRDKNPNPCAGKGYCLSDPACID